MKTPFEEILKNNEFIGIVEDNADPDKKQRVRVRIPYLHGEARDIPTDSLPWAQPTRDNNGLTFTVPDKNKIVNVTFPSGNLYYPVYNNAQHLNINLQKKVETYSGDDYTSFISLCYNHNTQIFVDNQKGLFIQHKEQMINIHSGGISLDLEDNSSKLVLGDENSDQEAMLGTRWMEWFDTLMQTLLDAYIGNNGAPCIANPNLINVFTQYQSLRKTFLSRHVYVVDNNSVQSNNIETESKIGDNFTINNKLAELTVKNTPLDPVKEQYTLTSTQSTTAQKREEIGNHIDEEIQNNSKNPNIEKVSEVNNKTVPPVTSVNKPVPQDNISVYVTYADATRSQAASAEGLENTPTPEHLDAMKYVAKNVFDPVYEYMLKKYGIKIKVNSFYRNPDVDYKVQLKAVEKGQAKKAVYGKSQHAKGQAIDIHAGKYNKELFYYIKNNIKFDQLLWEFGTDDKPNWVHVSLKKESNREQIAQMKTGGKFILYKDSTISPENQNDILT